MKIYASGELRNVGIVGHAHSGKTCLISAMLRVAKMPEAITENGAAVTAYDDEELARRMTMSNAIAFAEWNGAKINLLDTPGFHMFVHEIRAAMLPIDSAMVVVNAQSGIEPVTEKAWTYAAEANLARVIVVSQADHPKAQISGNFANTLDAMRAKWGRHVIPVQLPIVVDHKFQGVVDLVTMEAFYYTSNGDGQGAKGEIPPFLEEDARRAHEALVELVAEGNDDLMEEFFALGTIPREHLVTALHEAIREDRIFPVLFASGLRHIGIDTCSTS